MEVARRWTDLVLAGHWPLATAATRNKIFSDTIIGDSGARGEFITLARVVKTQGRRGEIAAEVLSDVPERFAEGMRLLALPANAERASAASQEIRRELRVQTLWPHKRLLVLKFAGVDSISQAEALVGAELQVPRGERAHLEPGWNYVSDLVGCSVFDRGNEIGRIEDVQLGAGEAPLLIVADRAGKKFDVPFAEEYVEAADTARKQIRMNLPEGMLEINGPVTAEEKLEQARFQQERPVKNRGPRDLPVKEKPRRTRR